MAGKKQRLKNLQDVGQRTSRNHGPKRVFTHEGQATTDFLNKNKLWDELNETSVRFKYMLRAHAAHSMVARSPEMVAAIEDKKLFFICIQGLAAYMVRLNAELAAISELHAGRTGGCTEHDEVMLTMEIFDRYQTFIERHDAILLPTTQILTNLTTKAEMILVENGQTSIVDSVRIAMGNYINGTHVPAAPAITPEQDPKVITDVEVK